MNEAYATQIARDWNVPASGSGYVTPFTEQVVGGSMHRELWVPTGELEEFNQHFIGLIEVHNDSHD